jgi:ATP-dependent 26S proteasome regulatory subunit
MPSSSSSGNPPPASASVAQGVQQSEREQILEQYRAKIREHRETEARLKRLREDVKGLVQRYQKTEDDLTALQSVGQIIGDVLKKLDDPSHERFIVKASSGPRYVVGCRSRLNQDKLKPGTRVALDMTTLTIMRILPREVDPTVFHMQSSESDKKVSFSEIGGLNEQIRELREVIELPLTNPELFVRVGIKVSAASALVSLYFTSITYTKAFRLVFCLSLFSFITFTSHQKVSFYTDLQEQARPFLQGR